MLTPTSR